jgi:hypothetical protein
MAATSAAKAASDAAGAATDAAEAAAGPIPELAAAQADFVEARASIDAAVQEAVETSSAARGTGPRDNLGGVRPGDSSAGDNDDVME